MTIRKSPTLLSETFSLSHFGQRRQLPRLFLAIAVRWLMTLALAAATYGVLYHYSSKLAMKSHKKRQFNTLIIALSIALGLNIASSLKHMVRELRWWVLSLYEWTPREADLILQSENISRLIDLGFVTRRHWIRVYVLVWVLINVASQIGVATLGLTYNVNSADKVAPTVPRKVLAPNLANIEPFKVLPSSTTSQATSALWYTANNYGQVAPAFGIGDMEDAPVPGQLQDPDSPIIFCDDDSCKYVFYDIVATNRSVLGRASCQSWKVIRGGEGNDSTIVIDDKNQTEIHVPALNGADQTTFMVNMDRDSGPSWSRIRAFEASTTNAWYYDCNVTIESVANATRESQQLGVNITKLAAPAIALQGYGSSTAGVGKSFQFQSYPAESAYGVAQEGNTTNMALTLSSCAIGVIAVTAQANTNIEAPGRLPLKGIELDISRWYYVHIIMGLTVGLQAVLAVVSVLIASKVTVRDHSYMAMAALLRPALLRLSHGGTVASEKQILQQLGPKLTLRYVAASNGVYYLRVTE
ncbi:hypothetical protein PT974_07912 [Cladobotryum mycophilum]|uniref:Uncharacterized protein n=1 Tax=Cladobotryum mycophilum TaxID=491253 RepID=A0ABR0SCV1_9HYPO